MPLAAQQVPILLPCMYTMTVPNIVVTQLGGNTIQCDFYTTLGCVPGNLGNDCQYCFQMALWYVGPPGGWVGNGTQDDPAVSCGWSSSKEDERATYGPGMAVGSYIWYVNVYGAECNGNNTPNKMGGWTQDITVTL